VDVITRIWRGLRSRAQIVYYRAHGVRMRGHVWLGGVSIPRNHSGVTLEAGAALDAGVVLLITGESARIEIGRNTYINRYTMLDASEEIRVGDECMIGPFCYITDHDHTFGPNQAPGAGTLVNRPTHLGARCWLGAHVTVLKGVTIGEGSVIGAGSVVTKSLPSDVVAAGNPARVLRRLVA
jgi:carbonic anhydrase/acetyltransferase-like protein (isoleucine patch superfamily)